MRCFLSVSGRADRNFISSHIKKRKKKELSNSLGSIIVVFFFSLKLDSFTRSYCRLIQISLQLPLYYMRFHLPNNWQAVPAVISLYNKGIRR